VWYEGWRNDVCSKARGVVDVAKVCGSVEVQCAWKGRGREGTSGVPALFFSGRAIVDKLSVVARVIVGT
jgi:hypothetical protein